MKLVFSKMELKDSKKQKLFTALRSQQFYEKLALAVEYLIKQRTRSGMDIDDKSFGDYSESYKKVRERHNLPTSPVSMTFDDVSGMLSKIDHVIANDFESASVFINDKAKEQIAYYWNIGGAGRKKMLRPFWGVKLSSELKQLADLGYRTLQDILKKL